MTITVLTEKKGPKISKYIYGQFAEHLGRCIYEGVWVGEDSEIPNDKGIRLDVVEALKEIKVPVVRWPGGCFADEYHWKDGIGSKEDRKTIVNTHWGGVVENNHFGTHEFFHLLKLIGSEAYVNGNVGSGTVQEMQEWVEYMTFEGKSPMADLRKENGSMDAWDVAFFGVGNESWGCGGNMRPEYYADLYRRYQTYVRDYTDKHVYKIACGPNVDDYNWMEQVMKIAAPFMDGISLHHYALTGEWEDKGSATSFPEEHWHSLINSAKKMDELITKHSTIMDKYDPEKRVGLIVDEWGSWFKVEPGTNPGFLYQQNTIRDAIVASLTLNIFHRHADRVKMANIAQMVNVLQAMLLTEGEKLIKTPTYHVFDLYKVHQDAELIDTFGEAAKTIDYTVSKKEGRIAISICHYGLENEESTSFKLTETPILHSEGWIVSANQMDAHNTFEEPEVVSKQKFENYTIENSTITVTLPPMSIATIVLEGE